MTDPEENTVAQAAAAIKADREQIAELANRLTNLEARAEDVRGIHARLDRQGERVSDLEVLLERHEEWRQTIQESVEKLYARVTAMEGDGRTVSDAHARLDRQREWLQRTEDLARTALTGGAEEARQQAEADRIRDTDAAQTAFAMGQLAADVAVVKAQMAKLGRAVHPDLTSKNEITRIMIRGTLFTVLCTVLGDSVPDNLTRAKVDELVRTLEANQVQLVLKADD
jgi:chromosome segregation ATPase